MFRSPIYLLSTIKEHGEKNTLLFISILTMQFLPSKIHVRLSNLINQNQKKKKDKISAFIFHP